jgi:hypothetical protein
MRFIVGSGIGMASMSWRKECHPFAVEEEERKMRMRTCQVGLVCQSNGIENIWHPIYLLLLLLWHNFCERSTKIDQRCHRLDAEWGSPIQNSKGKG